jgi:UDP-glucuronate decarboxylase
MLKQPDLCSLQSKRILITGGAGFLGSWLCDLLVSAGCTVRCIDDLSTGLESSIRHLSDASNFSFRKLDVTESNSHDGECEVIIHLASRASPEEYQVHPIETLVTNSRGTQNMLELARKNDAVLLYASTSEIYGDATVIPTPESYWGNVNPIGMRSCYDEGKRFGEALCVAYHRTYGSSVRILRLFNTYGPRLRADGLYGRAVSKFIEQALSGSHITVYGNGAQTRSFCYVTDTVAAMIRAATCEKMNGEIVNIGNPIETTILELAEKVKAITNSQSEIRLLPRCPDDPQRRCPDISKANRILKWSPSVTLDEGLKKTIEWFLQRTLE